MNAGNLSCNHCTLWCSRVSPNQSNNIRRHSKLELNFKCRASLKQVSLLSRENCISFGQLPFLVGLRSCTHSLTRLLTAGSVFSSQRTPSTHTRCSGRRAREPAELRSPLGVIKGWCFEGRSGPRRLSIHGKSTSIDRAAWVWACLAHETRRLAERFMLDHNGLVADEAHSAKCSRLKPPKDGPKTGLGGADLFCCPLVVGTTKAEHKTTNLKANFHRLVQNILMHWHYDWKHTHNHHKNWSECLEESKLVVGSRRIICCWLFPSWANWLHVELFSPTYLHERNHSPLL